MQALESIYTGIALLTFIFVYRKERPRAAAEWLTLVTIGVCWPLFLLWVAAGERPRD